MNRLALAALLGFSGLNHFFEFVDAPNLPHQAAALLEAFNQTGYLLHLVKVTEIACALLFITGLYVPLATILIAPIAINIFAFHLFLAPSTTGLGVSAFLLFGTAALARQNIRAFTAILHARMPASSDQEQESAQQPKLQEHYDQAG